jgi:predicted outer membrane repeat protein
MKNNLKSAWTGCLALLTTLLFIAGCFGFDYVNQPGSAQPDSSFVVQISASTTVGDGNPYIPYFGIMLPVGWTLEDSIGYTCDSLEGTFVYSDSISIEMENMYSPPDNYYWWVGAGIDSVIYNSDDTYLFNPVINTDDQTGHFYLSYMLGSSSQNYGGLGEEISEDHLITIGLPNSITVTSPANDGPGSLREAIDNIDFYGTINFDLDQNDTINLIEQLEVKKDCRINGPVNYPLVISGNNVTGIFHISSSPEISNLLLTKGFSYAGGAIYCENSSPVLKDLVITGNRAHPMISDFHLGGGGIYCSSTSPILENVTISNNSSTSRGGGIFFGGTCHPVFDSIKRCDIYMNFAAEGNDIFVRSDPVKVVLDTFSVLNPTGFHAAPISRVDFDILHGKLEQSNSDLYVSPAGNNSNNGLSAQTPLKNIHSACVKILADSLNPHTIHLLGGKYSPSLNGDVFPVCLPDYVDLTGDPVTETVLDAEGLSDLVAFKSSGFDSHKKVNKLSWLTLKHGLTGVNCYESDSYFENMTVVLENMNIANNLGSGVICEYPGLMIKNCTIRDNEGGGLSIISRSPILENVMISRNGNTSLFGGIRFGGGCNALLHNVSISENFGSGIVASGSENHPVSVTLNQVTIRDNTAVEGGGIYCERSDLNLSDVTIVNNTAHMGGGIFYLYGNIINFDTLHRCNIHSNRAFQGNDFYNSPGHIAVDTFSVLNPTEFHVYQAGNTTYDILHGKYAQIDSDLFVSPSGDNNNSGLTSEEPLKNIYSAMSRMVPGQTHTIRLLDGIYSPSVNNECFPINIYNKISISGTSKTNVKLDAEQTGGVIHAANVSSVGLSDMTITGGIASNDGGGIYCYSSGLTLKDLLITGNTANYSGGGLASTFCNPVIENCDIIANSACGYGGGIVFESSEPFLQNVRVSDNYTSTSGGGIYCEDFSQLTMKNVSIIRNTALELGGGICSRYSYQNCELLFDETDRCNIFLNRAAEGGDIYFSGTAHVVVDTFTVMNPMKFHALPLGNFTFDIQNSFFEQENSDLYVSPGGDNSKSGLSETEALKNIYAAAMKIKTDSLSPNTIHLLEGTYRSSSSAELFPLFLPEYTSLKAASSGSVILDAEQQNTVVRLINKSGISLSGMTIKGGLSLFGGGINCDGSKLTLKDVVTSENTAWRGGGIFVANSQLSIQDAFVRNNSSKEWNGSSPEAAGIYLSSSSAVIKNSVVSDNKALGVTNSGQGMGLDCIYSELLIQNSTLTGNAADDYGYQRPAGISLYESKPVIINSIIFGNYPDEILVKAIEQPNTLTVSYSDIRGGVDEIVTVGEYNVINWLDGNINEEPVFVGEGLHPFFLSSISPCINTGTPDTTGMNLPLTDIAGHPRIFNERIDMGAYEWNNVGISDFGFLISDFGFEVFPNPFRETTNFYLKLQKAAQVKVSVFNNLGQLVDVPVEALFPEGEHTVSWKPGELPEGIYLCRMQSGTQTATSKILLTK